MEYFQNGLNQSDCLLLFFIKSSKKHAPIKSKLVYQVSCFYFRVKSPYLEINYEMRSVRGFGYTGVFNILEISKTV